jgi:uncharacterized protein YdaU (DUF1376 family)
VNFFKLYIGDYMRDTGTLTVAEHGAYVLMLMHHYATERPLPTGRELHRLLRAESKAEREAIDSVSRRFWRELPQGLVNDRASAEMRRAEHQRDVNRSVGRLGGRPKRKETESVTESEPNSNPNQTPDTRHQTNTNPPYPPCPPLPDEPQQAQTAAGRACMLMRSAGLPDANPGHPTLRALIEAGAQEEEFRSAAAEAAQRGKPFAYALKVLVRRREEAAALVLHQGQMPARPATAAEQRVLQAVPTLAAKHLRPIKTVEIVDGTAKLMG